ncbi:MAG: DUF2214 family protein [Gammaproteobacteria bacterium]
MTGVLTMAWFHYLAMMFVMAALIAERLIFSPRPEPAIARKIVIVDLAYGISLLLVFLPLLAAMMARGVGS